MKRVPVAAWLFVIVALIGLTPQLRDYVWVFVWTSRPQLGDKLLWTSGLAITVAIGFVIAFVIDHHRKR